MEATSDDLASSIGQFSSLRFPSHNHRHHAQSDSPQKQCPISHPSSGSHLHNTHLARFHVEILRRPCLSIFPLGTLHRLDLRGKHRCAPINRHGSRRTQIPAPCCREMHLGFRRCGLRDAKSERLRDGLTDGRQVDRRLPSL